MIFGSSRKALVGLGCDEILVQLPGRFRQETEFKTFNQHAGGGPLSATSLEALMAAAADWVEQTLQTRKTVEVHCVISDPWVHQRVFQLDSAPHGRKATDALVRWRFGQELGAAAENLKVAWQLRAPGTSSRVLHGIGLDAGLYEALCRPWLKRRWPVASMVTHLHGLETLQERVRLDSAPFTVVLTDEYWLTWRSGPQPGVRCRWFADDPDSEALLRDIARAVNEEDCRKITVYGSDTAPELCQRINARFADGMAEDGLVLSELYPGPDSIYPGLFASLRNRPGRRA